MRDYNYCRVTSTLLGLTCAGLGSYGAFEFADKLEGTMNYLVVAAPVVAVTAALIPPIAEATWRAGGYVKQWICNSGRLHMAGEVSGVQSVRAATGSHSMMMSGPDEEPPA
jgi:hypothetical protein